MQRAPTNERFFHAVTDGSSCPSSITGRNSPCRVRYCQYVDGARNATNSNAPGSDLPISNRTQPRRGITTMRFVFAGAGTFSRCSSMAWIPDLRLCALSCMELSSRLLKLSNTPHFAKYATIASRPMNKSRMLMKLRLLALISTLFSSKSDAIAEGFGMKVTSPEGDGIVWAAFRRVQDARFPDLQVTARHSGVAKQAAFASPSGRATLSVPAPAGLGANPGA
mmetsp:Transcript_15594/g.37490  ORF Transcript_15594/g.37490 Transcript_15594/m.37490 type:complete len:223 (+) Transcript_15594:619-1287(+)